MPGDDLNGGEGDKGTDDLYFAGFVQGAERDAGPVVSTGGVATGRGGCAERTGRGVLGAVGGLEAVISRGLGFAGLQDLF